MSRRADETRRSGDGDRSWLGRTRMDSQHRRALDENGGDSGAVQSAVDALGSTNAAAMWHPSTSMSSDGDALPLGLPGRCRGHGRTFRACAGQSLRCSAPDSPMARSPSTSSGRLLIGAVMYAEHRDGSVAPDAPSRAHDRFSRRLHHLLGLQLRDDGDCFCSRPLGPRARQRRPHRGRMPRCRVRRGRPGAPPTRRVSGRAEPNAGDRETRRDHRPSARPNRELVPPACRRSGGTGRRYSRQPSKGTKRRERRPFKRDARA